MPICKPESTLGGKLFWNRIEEDTLFLVQEHKFGNATKIIGFLPFRILLKCNNYVVAQASSTDDIKKDLKSLQSYIATSSFNSDEKISLQSLQLIKICERLHGETIGTLKPPPKPEINTQVSPNSSTNALPVFYQIEEKKSPTSADSPPLKEKETLPKQNPTSEETKPTTAPRKATIEKNPTKAEETDSDSIPLEIAPEDIHFGEFIGEGVYSEVHKGSCYGSQVAIKKFKNQSLDPVALKGVRKEVRINKSIRHPNLLLFLGASTKPGHLMIITELMDKSFHDIHSFNFDILSKLRMAKEAAKGISWLHSLTPAIIHRDLKPENILIDKTGTIVKVADFGLSLVKDHSKTEAEEMRKIRGSPAFMSPEALQGQDLTVKSDVYSFGMILWELYTGGSPYEDMGIDNFDQLIQEVCIKNTRETIPHDCPQAFKKLIEATWKPIPSERPSFIQIIHQLDECILEVAISDKEGRDMWKQDFNEDGDLEVVVSWEHFLVKLASRFRVTTSLKIFSGLKTLLVKDEKNTVRIEDFGNILKWFGPMGIKSDDNFLSRMQSLFTKRWFHGDISVETAQTRLAGLEPGTFLVRFSSNPGSYALSLIKENQKKERTIVHIRILHEPAKNYSFTLDEIVYEFTTLDDLVKAQVLSLSSPCPGSHYYAQFRIKQVVTGYVNTVNT